MKAWLIKIILSFVVSYIQSKLKHKDEISPKIIDDVHRLEKLKKKYRKQHPYPHGH